MLVVKSRHWNFSPDLLMGSEMSQQVTAVGPLLVVPIGTEIFLELANQVLLIQLQGAMMWL